MAVYSRQIVTAQRMIAAKGELATWYYRGAPGGGKPGKPAERPRLPHPVQIVFFPTPRRSDQTREDGTEVKAGGLMGYMGQVPFAPSNGDTVERANGEKLTVKLDNGIEEINPNGEGVILYTIYFER